MSQRTISQVMAGWENFNLICDCPNVTECNKQNHYGYVNCDKAWTVFFYATDGDSSRQFRQRIKYWDEIFNRINDWDKNNSNRALYKVVIRGTGKKREHKINYNKKYDNIIINLNGEKSRYKDFMVIEAI